ncbi:MAG: sulfatase [Myxococcota bacterium]|nr:sulfatase [Myxococcota bacterium]
MILTTLLFTAGSALAGSAAVLDRITPASISLPESSRAESPSQIPITGAWRVVYSTGGVRTWETTLPIRPRTLFFHRAPGDMAVFVGKKKLKHNSAVAGEAGSWKFTSRSLQVRRPIADGPPEPGEYTMRYSTSVDREASLNRSTSSLSEIDFLQRSLQVDDTTRHGLFLPAPAAVAFQVSVPEDGVFDLLPTLIPPEASDPAVTSDGAVLTVAINGAPVADFTLQVGSAQPERIDLAAWAGQDVRLTLRTDPGQSSALDYVFVADPIVHAPVADPPRMVVIFLDTLRADHIGTYGYDRPTTPKLDAWAEGAAVFEQARSIAPWTLPSTRTMVTGEVPERWGAVPTIQGQLAEEGWATTFIAGNIYLSSNFEMADEWGEHRCINWPLASVQVDRALDYMADHADRPVFMMLHFMDMHLPYTEPPTYRYLFAGDAPEALPSYEFHLSQVKRAARTMDETGMQYIRDRYDNNLRYIDDQLDRFLSTLGPNDTVIVLADHGEEFWDHGGFEHGHTLYDELLHIPMIASGPGFAPGRHAQPVSMLDVSPSLAQAAGLENAMTGMALQDFEQNRSKFEMRPQAFGRPLYGSAIWGSLRSGQKYITREGNEWVFDVLSDPSEQDNLIASNGALAGREAMGEALSTEVRVAYRLTAKRAGRSSAVAARLEIPGGVEAAWPAPDPTQNSRSEVELEEESAELTWLGGTKRTGEIFVVPVAPAEEVVAETRLGVRSGREYVDVETDRENIPPFESARPIYIAEKSRVSMGYAVVPLPRDDDTQLNIIDAESCAALYALGYIEDIDDCLKQAQ